MDGSRILTSPLDVWSIIESVKNMVKRYLPSKVWVGLADPSLSLLRGSLSPAASGSPSSSWSCSHCPRGSAAREGCFGQILWRLAPSRRLTLSGLCRSRGWTCIGLAGSWVESGWVKGCWEESCKDGDGWPYNWRRGGRWEGPLSQSLRRIWSTPTLVKFGSVIFWFWSPGRI